MIFQFESKQPYFIKEKYDIKNNILREIDLNDNIYLDLIYWNQKGWNDGDIKIKIINTENLNDYFIKDIVDISIYDNYIIITWKPDKDNLSLCPNCNCMTKTINGKCGKCGGGKIK